MKKLIGSSLSVSMIALVFAACTATQTPRVASTRKAAGAGQPGYTMPPAEHVTTSQGGNMILEVQRAGAGNSRL